MVRVTRASTRGRGPEVDDELPPPQYMVRVMAMCEANNAANMRVLAQVERILNRNQNEQITIKDYIRLNPPVFCHSTEPLEADHWLRATERKLEVARVGPADRVTFAAYHLEGAASSWWENFLAMQPPGHVVTWEEFKTAFRGYHLPEGLMEQKKEEFLKLQQGNGSVWEYQNQFNRLACYAPEEVSTDAKKQALFRKGLDPEIRHDLNLLDFFTFQELMNKAMKAERGKAQYEETRKRPHDDSQSSGSGNKRRVFIPYSSVPGVHNAPEPTGFVPPQQNVQAKNFNAVAVNTVYRPPAPTCYSCGKPDHYSFQCTQNNAGLGAPPPTRSGRRRGRRRGRRNHVLVEEAQEDPRVILGTIFVKLHFRYCFV